MNSPSTVSVPAQNVSFVDPDGDVCGVFYVGLGNFYANIDGTLFSGPINADGSFSRKLDDMGEVENFEDAVEELHAAQRALGLPLNP